MIDSYICVSHVKCNIALLSPIVKVNSSWPLKSWAANICRSGLYSKCFLWILWLNKANNLLTSFRLRHIQMCKLVLHSSIHVMWNSAAITCTCVSHTHAHVCGYGLQKVSVCFCWYKSFQHSCSLTRYLSSDKPSQISLPTIMRPHSAHILAAPQNLSRLCVSVCMRDSMCLPLRLRECASVQNAWEQMWVRENVLVWASVWLWT